MKKLLLIILCIITALNIFGCAEKDKQKISSTPSDGAVYKYDDYGNKIRETQSDGKYSIYEYSDAKKGILAKRTTYNEEKLIATEEEYNENGAVTSIKYYEDGVFDLKTTYEFDETGNIIKKNMYDNTGKYYQYITSVYNADGEVAEDITYDLNSATGEFLMSGYTIYKYDDAGKCSTQHQYDKDGHEIF